MSAFYVWLVSRFRLSGFRVSGLGSLSRTWEFKV